MESIASPMRPSPPEFAGVDLERTRRPGVPREREPRPWPNTRFPPVRQAGQPSVPRHGRPGKPMPPVFGTAVPPEGLSGRLRRAAYRYPDHFLRHWMMLIAADRIDSMGSNAGRLLRTAAPGLVAAAGVAAWRYRKNRRSGPWSR